MYAQSIVAGILSIAALCSAAPLAGRSQTGSYSYNNGTSTTTAWPMSTSSSNHTAPYGYNNGTSSSTPPHPTTTGSWSGSPYNGPSSSNQNQPIATILPDFTSQYTVSTGAVDFHTSEGLVWRTPYNNGNDITTLVTFELDAMYSGNQCQLVFDLGSDGTSFVSGTGKAQLFTSLAPATADSESWPSGNLRNQALGTIDVNAYGRATWEAGSGPGATVQGKFPCSMIAGMIYGGEIAPVGDEDVITWTAGQADGPKILVF
ncbi:uncharacterized protein Z520_10033 [Fonsecaea multimorphosa CBS 102226]|uniref:Uncharacterized protein n=1 Tax=Fonsecaea multimorphosa CBS 102226 TaxID=1442371 RepID=A0A0D2KC73_9EURO|nr:uncharacterized protein Z520_10033 [Fonsecaea multimorphosa CBS 102226]KIX94323.1 hypothetical protein Z520_10033 [Fonsecaea multimorphosa CBS 102226]OAL19657.1 hypothetical protein AYO22_09529 [Fonsecaea multimorphosa]